MKKIIIFGIALFLVILSFNNISLISPKHNEETTETDILFRWRSNNEKFELYLDENRDFTSPFITETDNNFILIENLSVNEYYWFVKSKNKRSHIRKFRIVSLVSINRSIENNSLSLENSGNVDLNLSLSGITGFTILPIKKAIELGQEMYNITVRQK